MTRVRVKICCIADAEELALAVRHGADAVGLVSAMPSGPGVIEESLICELAARVPPPVSAFLLTREREARALIDQARRCGATTLQLVDRVEAEVYAAVRQALPGVRLVQVVHVTGEESVAEAERAAAHADALLLDSGNPAAAVPELGGTGRVHDWKRSAGIVARVAAPVFLAGGLTPDNVGEAIRTVRPFGVDLCNGVRSQGRLDEDKLSRFFAAVRTA